jgi:hypothetical protein
MMNSIRIRVQTGSNPGKPRHLFLAPLKNDPFSVPVPKRMITLGNTKGLDIAKLVAR